MRKNRLIWNIALFLTVITALPIAYAQAFTGSSWFFILINSAIVGVILFLLQSFLIPGKDPKEKTAVWVAMLVGSLLIGFFFGRSGFIWEHPVFARFFSIYVLVNSIIIGAALYFLSGFLDINKKLGTEGKGGLGILIFLIALIFAVQIGEQWIWQQNVVKQLVDYLFGSQGLLNPKPPEYRLWAFITVTTLLAFFFNGYLLTGGAGGTNKVNYALAILIGSSVARAGISFQSIVLLGEAIFTIVLAKALQGTAPQPKGIPGHWILAGFLVGWASAAMTYGTEYQGWLATFVGYPLWVLGLLTVGPTGAPTQPTGVGGWFGWIFKMGGGALIVLLLIPFVFLFIINRSETLRERRKRYKGVRNAYLKNIFGSITKAIMTRTPFTTSFYRLRNITGREPEIVHRNRLLFMRLLDQNLRFDIFYTKYMYMKAFAQLLTNRTEKLEGYTEQQELKKLILYLRSQKGKINIEQRRFVNGQEILGREELGDTPDRITPYDEYRAYTGWNYMNNIIILYMNNLIKFYIEKTTESQSAQTAGKSKEFNQMLRAIAETKEIHDPSMINGKIDASKSRYKSRLENYKNHHEIYAYTLWLWDMFNVSWRGYHPYRFAKKGAEYTDENGNDKNIDNDNTEVNVYGQFADDIRRLSIDTTFATNVTNGTIRIRRLKNPKRDSLPFPPGKNMGKIAEYYEHDWSGFIEDFREGIHHPFSRNVMEYVDEDVGAWKQGIWKDDDISWPPKGGSKASPAFDLRVLANPGIYTFWGREKYDASETAVERKNTEPHISQFGINRFILRLIDRADANISETKKFLQFYPADTGEKAKTLEEMKADKYAVGRFEEKSGGQ